MEKLPQNNKQIEQIFDKLNATCRIIVKDKIMGSGFFFKINFNHNIYNKKIIFIFTNNHILKDEYLQLDSEFEIEYINGGKNKKYLNEGKDIQIKKIINEKEKAIVKIDGKRLFFTNTLLDYTCVEIYENELLCMINYFESDDNINSNNPFQEYINQNCLIIQYPDEIFDIAKGPIVDINAKNQILYKISTEYDCSGSPIILTKNSKIIGIHCSRQKNNNLNNGIFLKPILENIQIKYVKLFETEDNIEYKNRIIDSYTKEQFLLNKLNW